MRVLIVDDDKLMLQTIAHSLEAEGYDVSVAEDGFNALGLIKNEKFDLIVSDILMPNMSGFELLNFLREFHFNKIPVIFISSLDKSDIISCSIDLGAKEFISKPIDFEALSLCVKKYVNNNA